MILYYGFAVQFEIVHGDPSKKRYIALLTQDCFT